jgi:hypothetical protein
VQVVLDDGEVSSDEDAPLQKRLRLSSDVGGSSDSAPAVPDVAVAMKKEATDRRAIEEAVVKVENEKEAIDKRAIEEAVMKEAADKEATDKRATKEAAVKEASVGAAGDSSAPDQAPFSVVGAKRVAVPSGSTPPTK